MYYRQVLMASLWIKHHLSYRLTGKKLPKDLPEKVCYFAVCFKLDSICSF